MQQAPKNIYSRPVLDFVTVSTEYCKLVENLNDTTLPDFLRIIRPMLSMLYLKATMVQDYDEGEGYNTPAVTEEDYNYIRTHIHDLLGVDDDFLDTFVEDFKYSDQPILCTVSENLADIYQALRDMVETFRGGYEDAMTVALYDTLESFRYEWGQKLLGALRALHQVQHSDNA